MEFKSWVTQQIEKLNTQLAEAKHELKLVKKQKSMLEKEGASTNHLNLYRYQSDVSNLEHEISNLKKVQKIEVVRLQTGAIISLSTLKAFNKKVSVQMWATEITQHPDGLKLTYTDGTAKGCLCITGFGVSMEVPDDVKLPVYIEGEVLTCSIQS